MSENLLILHRIIDEHLLPSAHNESFVNARKITQK